MASIEQARMRCVRLEPERRYTAFLRAVMRILMRERLEGLLETTVARALTPALTALNDKDLEELRHLWQIASAAIELSDDSLIDLVQSRLDIALDPSVEFRGQYQVLTDPKIPESVKRQETDEIRQRSTPQRDATRSINELNALLAVMITVTAYASHLIVRLPKKLDKVYEKYPWIPRIQLS